MEKECKHCKQTIQINKQQQFGAHVRNCKFNPNVNIINAKIKDKRRGVKENKKTCDRCGLIMRGCNFERHQDICIGELKKESEILKHVKEIDEKTFSCLICGDNFSKHGIYSHVFMKHFNKDKRTHYYNNSKKFGWAKGLSKETDDRLKKISETRIKEYKDGIRMPNFKGMEHSNKTKETLSLKQSKRLEENLNVSFGNVRYYKIKNILGEEFNVRGSYELKLAEWFNSKNILWIRKVYLKYNKNGVIKNYTPDFYLPLYDLYFETKGYFPEKDKIKMVLAEEYNKVNINMLFKKQIENLSEYKDLNEIICFSESVRDYIN